MIDPLPPTQAIARPYVVTLLIAYPLLAIAGAWTHRQGFALAALAVLASALMLPQLLNRRIVPWLLWLALLGALLLVFHLGFAGLLLEAIPILINALLAYWFGCTLATAQPRVAQIIVVLEGSERLAQRGVARYARQITWFWTLLLAAQALLLAVLLLCAEHSGLLARYAINPPLRVSERWAAAWLNLGGYLLLGAAFVLEYGWRRWRLRHLRHAGLPTMLLQLARHWPQLLRSGAAAS